MIEVFNDISRRMIEGIMFHEQMADYFDFLDLHGFKRQQEFHYLEESTKLRTVHRYAINHLNKMINDGNVAATNYIPANWYNATRMQVDTNTRKQSVREAFEKWFDWETSTKAFYEQKFKILTDNGKIADANKVNQLICDTDKELKYLTRQMLEYKAVDYSMEYIMYKQDELHEKYKEKSKSIGIDIC